MWLLAAVGDTAHAFVFMHTATNMVFGPEGASQRMNKRGERKKTECVRDRERIKRDDESVTEEMDANLEAWREREGDRKTRVRKLKVNERKKTWLQSLLLHLMIHYDI